MKDQTTTSTRHNAALGCLRAQAPLERARADLGERRTRDVARQIESVQKLLQHADGASGETLGHVLEDALEALGRVLRELQTSAPWAHTAAEQVAAVMASLYPLRRALESELQVEAAPIPLGQPKKRRAVLELVPEADAPVDERRELTRVALDVDIGLHSDTNFFTGFGDDVSEGGLFVATYSPLAIGTELSLSFVLPGGSQVSARGRVTWIRAPHSDDGDARPGMGVAFTSVDAAGLDAIREFMTRRAPLFYGD